MLPRAEREKMKQNIKFTTLVNIKAFHLFDRECKFISRMDLHP